MKFTRRQLFGAVLAAPVAAKVPALLKALKPPSPSLSFDEVNQHCNRLINDMRRHYIDPAWRNWPPNSIGGSQHTF